MAYIAEDYYISECCFAPPEGELHFFLSPSLSPIGFCSQCYDHVDFVREDFGSPWDTKEEKYGLR